MPLFRMKPLVLEAIKFTGVNEARQAEYEQFVGRPLEVRAVDNVLCLIIPTPEGEHVATPGDMIIKGCTGRFFSCKPDIFANTYEPVK